MLACFVGLGRFHHLRPFFFCLAMDLLGDGGFEQA